MAFKFCDSMIHQYRSLGYVIFRQILPVSLVRDLRKASVRVPEIARKARGPDAQRLQPIKSNLTDAEFRPFIDYFNLAPLNDAIHKIFTPRHSLAGGDMSRAGILIEPAEMPGCTAWHRDIRETSNVPDVEEFRRVTVDPLFFNQINCPLYEDNCTWYVPGSYLRQFDLEGETKAAADTVGLDDPDYVARERRNVEYCQNMPHSIRASMDAGDFMLYHPNGWHLGNYLPDRKRMTIHDFAPSPELLDWYVRCGQVGQKRQAEAKAKEPMPV